VLFTGDTAMGWSTTLVSPPDGDMAAFMETLRRLARRDDRLYLPGHGEPVEDPAGLLARQIAHREARAAQAIEALREGPGDVRALAPRIYRDIAPELLPAAERNLLATLIWLSEEGRVEALGPIRADTRFRLP
jgi:hydroxyacylglutathione hydrolase